MPHKEMNHPKFIQILTTTYPELKKDEEEAENLKSVYATPEYVHIINLFALDENGEVWLFNQKEWKIVGEF